MKTTKHVPRRDKCAIVGEHAMNLGPTEAALAWAHLSRALVDLGDRDVPKFADLLGAIRKATIDAKHSRLDQVRGVRNEAAIAMGIQDALDLQRLEQVTAKEAMDTGDDRQRKR